MNLFFLSKQEVLKNVMFFTVLFFAFSCKKTKKDKTSSNIDLNVTSTKPSLFAEGEVSTSLYERDIAITPDGKEFTYTLGDYKQHKRCLVVVKKENNKWQKPTILNISGTYQDIEPFYTNDGNRLYFASNRPIYGDENRKDYNIWYSDRIKGGWSDPVALDSIINTKGNEFFPAVTKKGNLFFTATRKNGIGREDIFIAKFTDGIYNEPEPLPETINSKFFEFNAYVSPDENVMIFSSFGRKDGLGGGDLYISQKDSVGNWKEAKNMGKLINSKKLDYCPFIDWNAGNFYLTSERMEIDNIPLQNVESLKRQANSTINGFGNIYRIGIKELGLVE
ncbi:exo-alpha-sialidase [Tenacibaculum sp. 190524A02b]|uniref:TolB family protein n=1 Tax=Tenacibaculum vairaonense TaxID=3137860 RepID=UPI0032B2086F